MYRFFSGRLGTDREKFICQIEPANPLCPYTEPQIGDIVNLPLGANDLDREPWIIKQRVVWDDQIEFMCERYIMED